MTDWPPGAPGVSVLGIRVGSAGAHGIRQRARRQHTGRSTCCMGSRTRQEPAQSDDLHFYGERGQQNSVARAQHLLVRIHLLSGRTEQAMAALQKSLGAGVEEHAVLEALCTAHRQAGRDVAARLAAQQLRHRDQAAGLSSLALTVEVYDSTRSARPWWHAAEQATRLAGPSSDAQRQRSTVIHAALHHWTAVDTELAHLLTPSPRWNELVGTLPNCSAQAAATEPASPPASQQSPRPRSHPSPLHVTVQAPT